MLKTIALLMLSTFAFGSGPSGCHPKQNVAPPSQTPTKTKPGSALKVLAEGFHSPITKPFVAVVRDAETYAELAKLDSNLPKLDADFFKSKVLIAAFLGERPTGGYRVDITPQQPLGHKVEEIKPGKWEIVPQMITSPYKVVSISVDGVAPLALALDYAWRQNQRPHRVISGSFTMTGGFAGSSERFEPKGELSVMRVSGLATCSFGLAASGAKKERVLTDFATGTVQTDNQITINRLSAGSFIDPPNAGLKATGIFTANDRKISLHLNSLPSMIADGYQGQGSLEAEIVDSAPKP